MEDENEVLDWGNEDDEQQHQDLQRKASLVNVNAKHNANDADDVEDSVSLGEDEDEQDRYGFPEEHTTSPKDGGAKQLSTPNSASEDGDQQRQPQSTDLKREDSSATQLNSSAGSPPHRNHDSQSQKSPQRSQSFTSNTRLTHALPPKPVATNVPFLHPSHPSIVEATAMSTRTTVRGGKSTSSGPIDSDSTPLPSGWEVRHPRGGGRDVYYYNIQTQESTWSRPELRSNRALLPGQSDIPDNQKSSSGSNSGLSYKDRHYRPAGAEDDSALVEKGRRGDRNDMDSRFNPQPDSSFTPPTDPHRSRERERSFSPPPILASNPLRGRDSRPSRGTRQSRGGRPPNTDSDVAMHGNRELPTDYGSSRGNWGPMPSEAPNDFNGYQQPPRRTPRQQYQGADPPYERPQFEERPNMRRNGSTRGRNRDHEHVQIAEVRENRTQNMISPRTRSPPHVSDREPVYQAQHELERPPTSISTSVPAGLTQGTQIPRKRDRPSRFDRPSASTQPELSSLIASFSTPEAAAAASRTRLEDDIHVPDEFLAPQDDSRTHDTARSAELTRPPNSQQIASSDGFESSRYPNARTEGDNRDYEKDRGPPSSELGRSPSSEARPKRVPLPPQSAKFREVAGPPPQRILHNDKGPTPQTQYRPQPQLSPLLSSNVLPLGPRPANVNSMPFNNPPSGPRYPPQNQGRDPEGSRSLGPSHPSGNNDRDRQGERRLSGSHSFPPSESVMDVDVDDHPSTSRIPPSPSSRKPNDDTGFRVGSGMYADKETDLAGDAPPRGPRAMAKPSVSTSGTGHGTYSTSPTTPFGYGPGAGRPRDRSPLPHVQGRSNDGNERREYEYDQYTHPMDRSMGRREPRPRPNDYNRPPHSSGYPLSGTNSVPIGSSRKPPVVLGAPPPGKTYIANTGLPPGISNANMEPVRNMRMRGPPPQKESYERPSYNEKPPMDYRPGRSENGAPRQRDNSPGPLEPQQTSPMNPNNPHDYNRGRRDSGYLERGNQGRYNQVPLDLGRAPRTWTPRDHDLPRPHHGQHRATAPPIPHEPPQSSSAWTPRDVARHYEDLSLHQRDRGPPMTLDDRPMQQRDEELVPGREHFGEPDVRRSGSLERRLSEPYKERYPEPVRQTHALPPNPALLRGHNPMHLETPWKDNRHEQGPPRSGWGEPRDGPSHRSDGGPPPRVFDTQARGDNIRGNHQPRIRRPQSLSQLSGDGSLRMEIDGQGQRTPQDYEGPQRPETMRRGGSLLDRLSLDQNGDIPLDGPPQSLRERVQVPSKRDREEMAGDQHGQMMDPSFEEDGYDPKKARRRNGKVRKVRRGGPP